MQAMCTWIRSVVCLIVALLILAFFFFGKKLFPEFVFAFQKQEDDADISDPYSSKISTCDYCEHTLLPYCCPYRFMIRGDLLYLTATENGFLCGCEGSTVIDNVDAQGNLTSVVIENDEHFDYDWDFGFRASFGLEMDCGWDLALSWMHFNSHLITHGSDTNDLHWHLHYDTLDLLLGYEFCLNSYFNVFPYGGVRGEHVEQKLRENFISTLISSEEVILSTLTSNSEQTCTGIGPFIGGEVEWLWRSYLGLFVGLDVGLLYGYFNTGSKDFTFTSTSQTTYLSEHRFRSCLAFDDAFLGIRFKHVFCNNNKIQFELGLEHHEVFDANQIGDNDGDLCLDGGFFSLSLGF